MSKTKQEKSAFQQNTEQLLDQALAKLEGFTTATYERVDNDGIHVTYKLFLEQNSVAEEVYFLVQHFYTKNGWNLVRTDQPQFVFVEMSPRRTLKPNTEWKGGTNIVTPVDPAKLANTIVKAYLQAVAKSARQRDIDKINNDAKDIQRRINKVAGKKVCYLNELWNHSSTVKKPIELVHLELRILSEKEMLDLVNVLQEHGMLHVLQTQDD